MAKKDKGWILLHRSLWDSEIWKDSQPFDRRSAWIDLIMLVNHEDGVVSTRSGKVTVPRGSTLTSYRHLANRWHWSIGKVQRFLTFLTDTLTVTLTDTQSGTLLSIVKYEDFQGARYAERYADRYTNRYQTKKEKNEYTKNSNGFGGSFGRRPASLEEKYAAIERNSRKRDEEDAL